MAATAEQLQRLDDQARVQQAANAAAVAALVIRYWRTDVDQNNLAKTGVLWLENALQAIMAGRDKSILISLAHTKAVRALQIPNAPTLTLPDVPAINVEQVRKSLTYTGLVKAAQGLATVPKEYQPAGQPDLDTVHEIERVKRKLEQRRVAEMENAAADAAAASVRHVQNGGREAVDAVVKQDKLALGYVRIARANCCYFCAALASRGPVYTEDAFDASDARFTGPGEHKVHDSCGCSLRAVYTRDTAEWPDLSLQFQSLWNDSTATRGDKMLLFRRAYEGRTV